MQTQNNTSGSNWLVWPTI